MNIDWYSNAFPKLGVGIFCLYIISVLLSLVLGKKDILGMRARAKIIGASFLLSISVSATLAIFEYFEFQTFANLFWLMALVPTSFTLLGEFSELVIGLPSFLAYKITYRKTQKDHNYWRMLILLLALLVINLSILAYHLQRAIQENHPPFQ